MFAYFTFFFFYIYIYIYIIFLLLFIDVVFFFYLLRYLNYICMNLQTHIWVCLDTWKVVGVQYMWVGGTWELFGLFVWTGTWFDYFKCVLYFFCLLFLKIKETMFKENWALHVQLVEGPFIFYFSIVPDSHCFPFISLFYVNQLADSSILLELYHIIGMRYCKSICTQTALLSSDTDNAYFILTVMDYTTHTHFKCLLIDFHMMRRWMETKGCLEQHDNHVQNSEKVELAFKDSPTKVTSWNSEFNPFKKLPTGPKSL